MVQLTTEQRETVTRGVPAEVSDGARSYYLTMQQQYEQLRTLLDAEEVDPSFYEFETADEPSIF